jgi:hypothetical protein
MYVHCSRGTTLFGRWWKHNNGTLQLRPKKRPRNGYAGRYLLPGLPIVGSKIVQHYSLSLHQMPVRLSYSSKPVDFVRSYTSYGLKDTA